MENWSRKLWPPVVTTLILWSVVAVLLVRSLRGNQGHLVYALDDPYIHMDLAKNLAQHGVWGITRYEFTYCSSSLLWTFLLSGINLVLGVNQVAPLVLNILFATLILFCVSQLFQKHRPPLPSPYVFCVLVAMVFLTPMPSLIFAGLEHGLHALVTILFVHVSAKALSEESVELRVSAFARLAALGMLITLIRFEGLFAVLVVCGLFFLKKRAPAAFLLGALALLPVVIAGFISVRHGWFWLPNSVLLKGNLPSAASATPFADFFGRAYLQFVDYGRHITYLILTALLLYLHRRWKRGEVWECGQLTISIFAATALLHMFLARMGWFFRYEAYLIALGLFALTPPIFEYLREARRAVQWDLRELVGVAAIVVFACCLKLLAATGQYAIGITPRATTNIYQQQYQMARFLKQFYEGAPVGANDVGAINFFADIHCLDLYGLGNLEVAKEMLEGTYDTQRISEMTRARGIKVAIMYDHFFYAFGGLPKQWAKVGFWRVKNAVVLGGDTVFFYAVDAAEKPVLAAHLKQFAAQLPPGVEQHVYGDDDTNGSPARPQR